MSNTVDLPPSDAPAPVVFFKRSAKGKSTFRKRAATPPPADSASEDEYSDGDTPDAPRIKKRKRTAATVMASSKAPASEAFEPDAGAAKYSASSREIIQTNDATKQSNWYDDEEAGLLGRKKTDTTAAETAATTGNTTYKGASGYGSFIKKSENSMRKPVGPVKAPTNIRTITVTDYAPDVCKDYKQTGFCGFGDTCKFLHAREDYAAGWKIDREWEIKQKGGKMPDLPGKKMGTGDWKPEEEKKEEEIPFKCVICKDDYKNPIQTKCGHYFCEKCAILRYTKKNPSCAICGRRTDGVFNGAKGLQKKLELRKQKEEEEAEAKRKEEEEQEGGSG